MSDDKTGDLIPDAVLQKQIGVVTELQDMLSEQTQGRSEDVRETSEALMAAIHGLQALTCTGIEPSPFFDADALAGAIEAGIDASLDARERQQLRDAGEELDRAAA